jgi:hypothetical protein
MRRTDREARIRAGGLMIQGLDEAGVVRTLALAI